MTDKGRRLGRGLESLIPMHPREVPVPSPAAQVVGSHVAATTAETPVTSGGTTNIAVASIRPNPFQPRREFSEAELAELQASIAASGLIQPVVVRRAGQGYELIAGERRFRAVSRLGWSEIPAIVRDVTDREALALALIENLQREQLNPIEEAEGYRRLVAEFGQTQAQVATLVGKDRSSVANALRLLTLPQEVQNAITKGVLSSGHGRALLALGSESSIVDMARRAIADKLTVRDLERLASAGGRTKKSKAARLSSVANADSAETRRITELLRRHLQTDVAIQSDANAKGEVRIRFYSAEDLQRILELITGRYQHGY